MINAINCDNTENNLTKLLLKIINPFSLYYLCNHFVGNEIKEYNINIPENKNDILITNNLSLIKDYDIIHVQVNYFDKFCNEILDKIDKKIILTTGQWHLPQIKLNNLTEYVLNHPNILLWVSQNPIYSHNKKYIAFPYGIAHYNLKNYASLLLKNNIIKTNEIEFLPINNHTNICRLKLPILSYIDADEFYKKLSNTKFIISPIGDRDDCYRHYEAIGLGTIPISNVSNLYYDIFDNNMYYTEVDEMIKIINNKSTNFKYFEPNKDLICFDYYKDKILNLITDIRFLSV
jgi:hypothetical protein